MALTLERIRALTQCMRANSVKPLILETEEQVRIASENDPTGHKWSIGDGAYVIQAGPITGGKERYIVPVEA